MYHYFLHDTAHAALLRVMLSIDYRNLMKIIGTIFDRNHHFGWERLKGPYFLSRMLM
jgi:hypothetical protein